MKRIAVVVALAAFAIAVTIGTTGAIQEKKPKHTISEVMKKVHKGGLLKKVISGQASPREKGQLLDYYVSLYENKPKKGAEASWTKRTADLVVGAAKAILKQQDAVATLRSASKCASCHKVHK